MSYDQSPVHPDEYSDYPNYPTKDETTKVQISQSVADGLEFVRRSGATNMFARRDVIDLAREWEFDETADWCDQHGREYGALIVNGFEIVDQ